MSRKQSFEDALRQKMNELPLPDENASWQKMSALLDETKKRRSFFFFRNEKMVSWVLLLCALLVWIALFVQKETGITKPVAYKDNVSGKAGRKAHADEATTANSNEKMNEQNNLSRSHSNGASSSSITSTITSSSAPANNQLSSQNKNRTGIKKRNDVKEKSSSMPSKEQSDLEERKLVFTQLNMRSRKNGKAIQADKTALQKQDHSITEQNAPEQKQSFPVTDSFTLLSAAAKPRNIFSSDSIATNQSASESDSIGNIQNKTTTESKPQKEDSAAANTAAKANIKIKPRSTWFVDAGIGIKQQFPIDSQRFVSYNYNANKSWFGDYIPFLYLRLEKNKKWFLQGEFHYAAPRLINGVSYWQKSKVDYSHSTASAERYDLQKVWYNEVPLSLNIYIRPSWSVGAGAMVSWLRGAAVQRTTTVYDATSGQYSSSNKQLPWKGFTDSFLYKNNTSLLLQTDYGISKWLFGIRYLRDLHPYLTYTLPAGEQRNERNASLEMMIRYRLYRSDKFRIGKL